MDIASIIGLLAALALMVFGMVNGNGFHVISDSFMDTPSALITFGGAFGTVLAMYPLSGFLSGLKSFVYIFKVPKDSEVDVIKNIIELSNLARREGLLALEESTNSIEDEFLKKGILLIVDGTDPELVRSILEAEIVNIDARHQGNIGFWKNVGAMGPAWGMIGTLIGLILMLKDLSDMASIGPNMAVALITTLYGSVLANWVCSPVANKLSSRNDSEIMLKEIMVEGILSIQAGENPRVIEEKLKAFISPKDRSGFGEEGGAQ